jgi:hypothetical protein
VGRASAVLVLAAALIAWYEVAPHLGEASLWWSVTVIAVFSMPSLFGMTFLALPLWRSNRLLIALPVLALLAIVLSELGQHISANFAKFAAVTAAGWCFLWLIEELSWTVLVALIIPWVDAYSVWRGPTKGITSSHPHVFDSLSVAFVSPGGDAARLGLPDIFFFSVFLAATMRFGLRPLATWVGMTAALGGTVALVTWWNVGGLPALPAISLGFLLPNADLLWQKLRGRPLISPGSDPRASG